MTYAIKRNMSCQAWELGRGSGMEREMISQGRSYVYLEGVVCVTSCVTLKKECRLLLSKC